MKCTDIVETCTYIAVSFWMQLFDSPGWLACRLGLAAALCQAYDSTWQVQAHEFNRHQPLQPPLLPPPALAALPATLWLGAAGGSSPPGAFPAAAPSGGVAGGAGGASAGGASAVRSPAGPAPVQSAPFCGNNLFMIKVYRHQCFFVPP